MEDKSAMACTSQQTRLPTDQCCLSINKNTLPSYLFRCLKHLLKCHNTGVIQVLNRCVDRTIQKHTGRYSIKWATSHAAFICGQYTGSIQYSKEQCIQECMLR